MTPQVRSTVAEAENAVRVFTQLSAASDLHVHGFDGKKIQTHVQYCTHLLEAAKVHREAAEHEELQNRQRLEVARQAALAEEARRKAEEQRKYQVTTDLQVKHSQQQNYSGDDDYIWKIFKRVICLFRFSLLDSWRKENRKKSLDASSKKKKNFNV